MVELTYQAEGGHIGFSGDVLNTAAYLARYSGAAARVEFISVVGRDSMSAELLAFARAQGVGTEKVRLHPTRLCGIYSIDTDMTGERSFSYWRDNSAARTLFQDGFDALDDFDIIYLSGITLAIIPPAVRFALIDHLSSHTAAIVFDSNYRPRLWEDQATARMAIESMWRATDVALASADDEIALFGDHTPDEVAQRLRRWGIKSGCVKCGANGAIPLDLNIPAPKVEPVKTVVDTTAAGDSFNGAYLAQRIKGGSEVDAFRAGCELAAQVIQHHGAILPESVLTSCLPESR